MITTFSAPELDQLAKDWSLTYKLDLPENPVIVVAGAYQGRLMRLLAELYPKYQKIVGFEPQQWAALNCIDAVSKLPRMTVVNLGLLAAPAFRTIAMGEFGTDACSVFETTRESGQGHFSDAVMELASLPSIDLFVMNMEGYEFDLLPYFISTGLVKKIHHLAVQFHLKYKADTFARTMTDLTKEYTCLEADFPRWMLWAHQ